MEVSTSSVIMGCISSKSLSPSQRGPAPSYLDESNPIVYDDTQEFVVPITYGRVIKVYDADTITIAARLNGSSDNTLYRFSVRINGIDAPEIKSADEDEKNAAIAARDYVRGLILHKNVYLANIKNEKYGRVLADVYYDVSDARGTTCHVCLSNLLLTERYAVEYHGGTKHSPASWTKYKETGQW